MRSFAVRLLLGILALCSATVLLAQDAEAPAEEGAAAGAPAHVQPGAIAENILEQRDAQVLGTFESWQDVWGFFRDIWVGGGWLMIPLGLLAFVIYFVAVLLVLRLWRAQVRSVPRETWEGWLDRPDAGEGHVGDVVRFVSGDRRWDSSALLRLEAVRSRIIPDINAWITVLSILVTIAPLMGLLGTVIGMLETFRALAESTAQGAELVAAGIKVALITTQTGLMIAIPGYMFIAMVLRNRNLYLGFLSELETVVVQRYHARRVKQPSPEVAA